MNLRDLDAEVAAKVLGCAVLRHQDGHGATVSYDCGCDMTVHGDPNPNGGRYTRIRRYSEDWGAMREVVHALERQRLRVTIEIDSNGYATVGAQSCDVGAWADATTLPEAMANVALAAVAARTEEPKP